METERQHPSNETEELNFKIAQLKYEMENQETEYNMKLIELKGIINQKDETLAEKRYAIESLEWKLKGRSQGVCGS